MYRTGSDTAGGLWTQKAYKQVYSRYIHRLHLSTRDVAKSCGVHADWIDMPKNPGEKQDAFWGPTDRWKWQDIVAPLNLTIGFLLNVSPG